jgi:hypothetical protein
MARWRDGSAIGKLARDGGAAHGEVGRTGGGDAGFLGERRDYEPKVMATPTRGCSEPDSGGTEVFFVSPGSASSLH